MSEELRPCPFCMPRPDLPQEARLEVREFDIVCKCGALGPYLTNGLHVEAWNSAWCWKEIDRLKKAAESEYQRAESIEYNKKWFQEEIVKRDLEAKLKIKEMK